MIISKIVFILMPLSIILSFLWAPPADILGEASRIVYYHVPLAWISFLAFIVSGIISIVFIIDRERRYRNLEEMAYNSAVIGFTFALLTTISGSIWAKINWGIYWNWDPRETSIVFLLSIYIAYFALRFALMKNEDKKGVSSSYLIIAMVTVPFFIFIYPRIVNSLHPETIINFEKKIQMDQTMMITLIVSVISFSMLYLYIFRIMNRILSIEKKVEENLQ